MLGSLTFPSQPTLPFHRRLSTRAAVSEAASPYSAALDRKSLYEVLRVTRNASQVEIKTAYRTLAKLYHPDATSRFMDSPVVARSTDGRDFIEIHEAYTTLSDPDARAMYDSNFIANPRRRLKSTSGGESGLRSSGRVGVYTSRRWETDQCW